MLKVHHTAYPDCRKHEAGINQVNSIKDGGLWGSDRQNQLLQQANEIIKQPVKRKDEFKEFAKIFWAVVIGVAAISLLGYLLFNIKL